MTIGLDSRLVKVVTIRDSAKLLVEMLRRDAQHVVFVQKTMGRYMVQRLEGTKTLDVSSLLRDQVFRCMSRNLDNTEEMAKYCGWDVSDGKPYHQ